MTVERVNGMIVITDIINGYLVRRKYIGYSVRDAKREFKTEMRDGKSHESEVRLWRHHHDSRSTQLTGNTSPVLATQNTVQ